MVGAGSIRVTGGKPRVRIGTPCGAFTVELESAAAPLTAAHFLRFAAEGHLKGSTIYRIVTPANCEREPAIAVIQFGWYPRSADERPPLPPVPHESFGKTGLRHLDGTISLARLEPGTGSSAFFVCLGDQPQLDEGGGRAADGEGFAAFGRVVEGREVLDAIASLAREKEWLPDPIPVDGHAVDPAGRGEPP